MLSQIQKDRELSERLGLWGNAIEAMMLGNLKGTIDTWAVFWSLLIIKEKGYCLSPYQSLVQNDGFDGEGRHCGSAGNIAKLSTQRTRDFRFPSKVEILPEIEEAFARSGLFRAVKDFNNTGNREKILVYGIGDFYRRHEQYLYDNYKVVAYIDRVKSGFLNGKDIVRLGGIRRYEYDKIVVMLQNIGQCMEVAETLVRQGVDAAKIALGHDIVNSGLRFWDKSEWGNNGLTLHLGETRITVACLDEFNRVAEVFRGKIYDFCLNSNAGSVILDIGLNIGDAALCFLEHCPNSTVYGFEPFLPAFERAHKNLEENGYYPNQRIHILNYGLSDRDETGKLRQASAVIADIRQKHPNDNMVLKVDCQDEECAIVKDLDSAGFLGDFKIIMVKWHCQDQGVLEETLKRAGHSYWNIPYPPDLRMIYAFKS
jgi:hypothetical protein